MNTNGRKLNYVVTKIKCDYFRLITLCFDNTSLRTHFHNQLPEVHPNKLSKQY